MATASRSLATALWGARFASGLLRLSYTTPGDTTRIHWFNRGAETNISQHHHAWVVFDHAHPSADLRFCCSLTTGPRTPCKQGTATLTEKLPSTSSLCPSHDLLARRAGEERRAAEAALFGGGVNRVEQGCVKADVGAHRSAGVEQERDHDRTFALADFPGRHDFGQARWLSRGETAFADEGENMRRAPTSSQ